MGPELSGVPMMAFVVSAVTVKLNRWGHPFVWGLCQSPEPLECLWLHLPSLSLLYKTPPRPSWRKSSKLPPLQEELAQLPPLSTPSLNMPFWRADFYLYLAGDWQLTFCTGGNFWEWGQYLWAILNQTLILGGLLCICSVSCCPYVHRSKYHWHICISPCKYLFDKSMIQCHTPHPSFFRLLFLGRIIGCASTSFHFQPQ